MALKRQAKLIDAMSGEVIYADPIPPQIKLNNANEVRREMARVYRDARGGAIDTSDGSKLVYMLSVIAKAVELSVIEERISLLEKSK